MTATAVSRRELFRDGAGVALVVVAARLRGAPALARLLSPAGPEPLALADFAAQVGTPFDVRVDGGRSVPLILVEAVDRPAPVAGEAFSLLFVGAPSTQFAGATYTFSSRALGRFPLFVTPLGPGRRGQRYEAVVNRRPQFRDGKMPSRAMM